MTFRKEIGKLGESIASEHLQKNGYTIIELNAHDRWGELDIIAKKNDKIAFVEVKTRIGTAKGKPYEAVNAVKLRHLHTSIQSYVLKKKLSRYKLSLDVVSIVLNADRTVESIQFFENVTGY